MCAPHVSFAKRLRCGPARLGLALLGPAPQHAALHPATLLRRQVHGSFVKSVYVHALTSSELTVLVEYNADTPSRARIEVVAEGVAGTVHSDS